MADKDLFLDPTRQKNGTSWCCHLALGGCMKTWSKEQRAVARWSSYSLNEGLQAEPEQREPQLQQVSLEASRKE